MEGMRQEMIHQFTLYTEQMDQEFAQALDEAVKSFDYKSEVEAIALPLIREELKSNIQRAFWKVAEDSKFQTALEKLIREAMEKGDDSV